MMKKNYVSAILMIVPLSVWCTTVLRSTPADLPGNTEMLALAANITLNLLVIAWPFYAARKEYQGAYKAARARMSKLALGLSIFAAVAILAPSMPGDDARAGQSVVDDALFMRKAADRLLDNQMTLEEAKMALSGLSSLSRTTVTAPEGEVRIAGIAGLQQCIGLAVVLMRQHNEAFSDDPSETDLRRLTLGGITVAPDDGYDILLEGCRPTGTNFTAVFAEK